MKKFTSVITVLLLICASYTFAFAEDEDGGEEMKVVVGAIQKALQDSVNVRVDGFTQRLNGVKIELNTTVSKKAGGGVNFWIFSFGKSKEKETTSTITVEMKAPSPQGGPQGYDPTKVANLLTDAIIEAKKSYVAASGIDSRLTEGKVVLSFKFLVKSEIKGGAKITEIIPVGLDANGSYSKSQVHTITLTFST